MGEKHPDLMEQIGIGSFKIVSQECINMNATMFVPSSIAVYGNTSTLDGTPEETACEPLTIYGCTKVYLELIGSYYKTKYGLDFRCLRYPGVFTAAKPGGGTTDYVTLMMYDAIEKGEHDCYLRPDSFMPMIHQEDLIKATVDFISAEKKSLSRPSYNIGAFSCSPETLRDELHKYLPNLKVNFNPDYRQTIADSWPNTTDTEMATKDWGFSPKFDFEKST